MKPSLLPKLINSGELDDYDEEDDKDYTPQTPSFKYKEPRMGENYQVDERNIPKVYLFIKTGRPILTALNPVAAGCVDLPQV